jgi:hypothetical protein
MGALQSAVGGAIRRRGPIECLLVKGSDRRSCFGLFDIGPGCARELCTPTGPRASVGQR